MFFNKPFSFIQVFDAHPSISFEIMRDKASGVEAERGLDTVRLRPTKEKRERINHRTKCNL